MTGYHNIVTLLHGLFHLSFVYSGNRVELLFFFLTQCCQLVLLCYMLHAQRFLRPLRVTHRDQSLSLSVSPPDIKIWTNVCSIPHRSVL